MTANAFFPFFCKVFSLRKRGIHESTSRRGTDPVSGLRNTALTVWWKQGSIEVKDYSFPVPFVYGSPLHLRQIILNILGIAFRERAG